MFIYSMIWKQNGSLQNAQIFNTSSCMIHMFVIQCVPIYLYSQFVCIHKSYGMHLFLGVFGTVYKTRDVSDGNKIVATVKLEVPLDKNGMPTSTLREIAILRQIHNQDHPNVVKYVNVIIEF